MPVRIVQSKQNARLKELRRAVTRPGRDTHGLAGIEGRNLLEEALRANLRVACIFAGHEADADPRAAAIKLLEGLPVPSSAEVLALPRTLLNPLLETETPQPLAALVEMPDWTWAHALRARSNWPPLVIVLAGVRDPGNLGTILRSAEAFGASGIIALPGTVSAWNSKTIRASAGSIFRMPVVTCTPEECFATLREAGTRILTTTARGAEPADMANLAAPVALLIGNEGSGVPEEIATHADERVTIPCPGAVESLNAAVATSILLYEASRQRFAGAGGKRELRGSTR